MKHNVLIAHISRLKAYSRCPLSVVRLICYRKQHTLLRRFAGQDALAVLERIAQRNAANGGLSLLLDQLLGFGSAVPVGVHESGLVVEDVHKLVPSVGLAGVVLSELHGSVEQTLLDFRQQFFNFHINGIQ